MFARFRQDNTIRYHLNSTRAANVSTYPEAERTTNITVRKIRSVMRKIYVSPLCVHVFISLNKQNFPASIAINYM